MSVSIFPSDVIEELCLFMGENFDYPNKIRQERVKTFTGKHHLIIWGITNVYVVLVLLYSVCEIYVLRIRAYFYSVFLFYDPPRHLPQYIVAA